MKKMNLKVVTCLVAGSLMFSSCFVGSYGLFNSYAKWQTNMTGNKFVNAIVGFIIGPICEADDGQRRTLLSCNHYEEWL